MHPSHVVEIGDRDPSEYTDGDVSDARVLLFQEEPRTVHALRRAVEHIESAHVEVVHVATFADLRRHLEQDTVALVVVDLTTDVATKVRHVLDPDDAVAVIGIAPALDEAVRRRAADLGAAHVLVETEGFEELLRLVARGFVEHSRLRGLAEIAGREARSAHAQLLEALMHVEQPALVVGPEHKVLFANRAATDLLGCAPFRLLATKFPSPLRAVDAQTVVLPDGRGGNHVFSARTLRLRWGCRPARLVLVRAPVHTNRTPPCSPASAEQLATFAATGSEINARSTRVEAALQAALDHRTQLRALVKQAFAAIGRHARLFGGTGTPNDAEAVVEDLLDSWHRALVGAIDDTRRIQRLAAHVQRSAARSSGSVELTSVDAIVRGVCKGIQERLPDTAISHVCGAGATMVTDARRFETFLDRLLTGVARGLRDHGVPVPTLAVRTRASGETVVVSLEAHAAALAGRERALLQWITAAPDPSDPDELAEAADLLQQLRGKLRFGLRSDGTLWLQAALAVAQPGA